jgi:AcrR family transcriptional regulator
VVTVKEESNSVGDSLLPPSVSAVGTERLLLETAVSAFAQRGYHGVSVRDITVEVGIKPASMYAHYASKEDLLVELLRVGHQQFLEQARQAVGRLVADPTPTEQLRAIVRSYVWDHAQYPLLSRVCANEINCLSAENMTSILALRLESLTQLSTVLSSGIDTGEFHIDEVFLAAMAIAGMTLRVANWYSGNESGLEFGPVLEPQATPSALYPIDQVADTYADFALRLVT